LDVEFGAVHRWMVGVNMGRQIEESAVPRLGAVVRDVGVVTDQVPTGEVCIEVLLVLLEDRDIDVEMLACLATDPGIHGPAAAQVPRAAIAGHEVAGVGEWWRYGWHTSPFSLTPVDGLTDGSIVLRPWREADADWYVDQVSDPEIQRFTSEPADLTVERATASISAVAANPELLCWAITAAGTDELLGNAGVHASTGEMYYWVAAPARGRGVATAAVRLMTAYCFHNCDIPELSLLVRPGNNASIRVAEKSGFANPSTTELAEVRELVDRITKQAVTTMGQPVAAVPVADGKGGVKTA